jgi:hypothetical protein
LIAESLVNQIFGPRGSIRGFRHRARGLQNREDVMGLGSWLAGVGAGLALMATLPAGAEEAAKPGGALTYMIGGASAVASTRTTRPRRPISYRRVPRPVRRGPPAAGAEVDRSAVAADCIDPHRLFRRIDPDEPVEIRLPRR